MTQVFSLRFAALSRKRVKMDSRQKFMHFEAKLSKFNTKDLLLYFANEFESLAEKTCDSIIDVIDHGFDVAKFDTDIWLQTARAGAETCPKRM